MLIILVVMAGSWARTCVKTYQIYTFNVCNSLNINDAFFFFLTSEVWDRSRDEHILVADSKENVLMSHHYACLFLGVGT